jgi:hypothetical protein
MVLCGRMGGFKTLKGRDVEDQENVGFDVSFVAFLFPHQGHCWHPCMRWLTYKFILVLKLVSRFMAIMYLTHMGLISCSL